MISAKPVDPWRDNDGFFRFEISPAMLRLPCLPRRGRRLNEFEEPFGLTKHLARGRCAISPESGCCGSPS